MKRTKVLQLLGGLVMERKTEKGLWVISLGRLAFWVIFLHLLFLWQWGSQPPDASEMSVFYSLLGYQGIKVARDGAVDIVRTKRPTQ